MNQEELDRLVRLAINTPAVKVRKNAHETELDAAGRALPRSGTQRRKVYDYLVSSGGATDEEVQIALGINHNSQTPRRLELVEAGLVVDSGQRRATISGASAIVWKVTSVG